MSLTLYFLRFSMGINAAIAAFWLGGTVIPFIISPPSSFSWAYFKAYRPTDLLQGYGLHNTFLLYGKGRIRHGRSNSAKQVCSSHITAEQPHTSNTLPNHAFVRLSICEGISEAFKSAADVFCVTCVRWLQLWC